MFTTSLLETYAYRHDLVALCDTNQTRMDYWNREFVERFGIEPLPTYRADRFAEMLERERVDSVIVTTVDRTHHTYICAAMEASCDVLSEKPMTITAETCSEILETQARTGRDLKVTFNYRYAPRNTRVKELLRSGAIGRVVSVHFEWLLNTKHGADYFRRWHRDKINSGGLMVHKSTHHFDLVNWWLDSEPTRVFAQGGLRFYGKDNARERGITEFYERAHGSDVAAKDPFAIDLASDSGLKGLYLDAEHEDGYYRDQSVFGEDITAEDDVAVLVNYSNGATMTYHLTAYSPWEGYRVAFNGAEGRLELSCVESAYVSGSDTDHNAARNVQGASEVEVDEPTRLVLQRHWEKPQEIDLPQANQGGHGGADTLLLQDCFDPQGDDPLGRAAGHLDGARSILTGIAANRSMETGLPVDVSSLLPAGALSD